MPGKESLVEEIEVRYRTEYYTDDEGKGFGKFL